MPILIHNLQIIPCSGLKFGETLTRTRLSSAITIIIRLLICSRLTATIFRLGIRISQCSHLLFQYCDPSLEIIDYTSDPSFRTPSRWKKFIQTSFGLKSIQRSQFEFFFMKNWLSNLIYHHLNYDHRKQCNRNGYYPEKPHRLIVRNFVVFTIVLRLEITSSGLLWRANKQFKIQILRKNFSSIFDHNN